MRTKLLLTAAAIAAGVVSSQAQSNVYSVNVVGYVNKTLPISAMQLSGTPLDDGTNKLSSALAGAPNGTTVYVWNGAGYNSASKAKGSWSTDLSIPPGVGMFIQSGGTAGTNTYVGQVTAQVGGSVSNAIPAGVTTLRGSMVPYAGDLNDTNLALGTTLANGSIIYKWTGAGYTSSSKAKGSWSTALSFSVGEAMFINSATATQWVQKLPAN